MDFRSHRQCQVKFLAKDLALLPAALWSAVAGIGAAWLKEFVGDKRYRCSQVLVALETVGELKLALFASSRSLSLFVIGFSGRL